MSSDVRAAYQLRTALSLLALPHVRDFLLSPDPLVDATILTNPARRASSFPFALHRVIWGSPVLESQAFSRWLCAPAFSLNSVTVGVIVQRLRFVASPGLMKTRPSGQTMLRCAVDANAGVLLTVSAESPAGTVDIQYAGFHSLSSRGSLNAVLRAAELREAIANDFNIDLLRQAHVFSFAYREERPCVVCSARGFVSCVCAPGFPAPSHPLDFSSFLGCMAHALGDYAGSGENQLTVYRGDFPICAKNMSASLAVRHLDDADAVNALWKWGVQTRFAELPIYPAKVEVPFRIQEPPDEGGIVKELCALRDEEERKNSLSAAALVPSLGSTGLSIDSPTCMGGLFSSSPVVLEQQVSDSQSVFGTPCALDQGPIVEAVTPPRAPLRAPPCIEKEQFSAEIIPETGQPVIPETKFYAEHSVVRHPQSFIQQPSQALSLSDPVRSSSSLPMSHPDWSVSAERPVCTEVAGESFRPVVPSSSPPLTQTVDFTNNALNVDPSLSIPESLTATITTSSALPSQLPPRGVAEQPCAQRPKQQHILPSEAVSDVSSSTGVEVSNPALSVPFALNLPMVVPCNGNIMPDQVHAVQTPYRRPRVAARIEKNPHAPPVQLTTYIGERDRKIMDRKERNRRSAARSNLRRKHAREELEQNLAEAVAKVETLKQREAALKEENENLKKSLSGIDFDCQNLCETRS